MDPEAYACGISANASGAAEPVGDPAVDAMVPHCRVRFADDQQTSRTQKGPRHGRGLMIAAR